MGILDKITNLFGGSDDVAPEDFKTISEFYDAKYAGLPEVTTRFDGKWRSEAVVYLKLGGVGSREVFVSDSKAEARALAKQWIQNTMQVDYQPEKQS